MIDAVGRSAIVFFYVSEWISYEEHKKYGQ